MSTVVGQKGQVTIEAPIRAALGIGPGWRALQQIEDGKVVMRFVPPKHNRSLLGILKDATSVRIESEDELREAIEESWIEAVGEADEPYRASARTP